MTSFPHSLSTFNTCSYIPVAVYRGNICCCDDENETTVRELIGLFHTGLQITHEQKKKKSIYCLTLAGIHNIHCYSHSADFTAA